MEAKFNGIIWVCSDCMLHHDIGECGGCHSEHGHDEEPLCLIRPPYTITMGKSYDEHLCEIEGGCYDSRSKCDCATDTYSTSQCDGCGSYLHGERHAMTLWDESQ